MTKKFIIFIMLLTTLLFSAAVLAAEKVSNQVLKKTVYIKLDVEGIIDAATADYVVKGITLAEKENASGVLLTIQTPGGLDKSMRKICDKMLSSKIPVITYITPKGARAASAGVFILLSSSIAAMADGTNIGTAHPVDFQGKISSEKITNDAVAYIKNLARLKNRNEKWAEEAIIKNISSSEIVALKEKVIDLTAKDTEELMKKLNKFKVNIAGKNIVLDTTNYEFNKVSMSQKHKFLHQLSDPNIVYVLFLIGIYGLIFELANAGTVVIPGIAGTIAIVLAFIGFDSLPINTAGLILIGLSAILFFLETMNPTHGVLSLGGLVSMILGSLLLFPSRGLGEEWAVSYMLMVVMILITVAFFLLIVAAVIKAFKKKTITGVQILVGLKGVVSNDITQTAGIVNVGGEDWQAVAEEPIAAREIVEVLEVNGMKLKVKKIPRKIGG